MTRNKGCRISFTLLGLSLLTASLNAQAVSQPDRPLKTLNGYFPFQPPENLTEWHERRSRLQRHIQVSLGLWPMPERTPLQPVIHGKIDRGSYTVEKVYFESFPGYLVTGNLYRPKQVDGKIPGVLCPHGHFREGRFRWATDEELERELKSGAESFATNGRSPLQARCANLAMMGCVVFHYDMVGYADNKQISYELAHRFSQQRPDMNGPEAWGFFSPAAEMRLQSIMGLQTWNSIRSLDFICSLEDVDASRIGVTGGSGGGTQTFMLCAIDPRPAVAFPAVMVSTAMQGGCTCENCSHLRVMAGNVDFAALFAPKPLGLTAADDWTVEMSTKGFPELRQLYSLYQEEDRSVPDPELLERLDFPHNYNQVSRQAMYDFFNRHLGLEHSGFTEQQIEMLSPEQMTVFDEQHPRPDWSDDHEKGLLQQWERASGSFLQPDRLRYAEQLDRFDLIVGTALHSMVSVPDEATQFSTESSQTDELTNRQRTSGTITFGDTLESAKLRLLMPSKVASQESTRIQKILFEVVGAESDSLDLADVADLGTRLANRDTGIASLVLPEFGSGADAVPGNRLVDNGRQAAGYTFGYNRTALARRVARVKKSLDYLSGRYPDAEIDLICRDERLASVVCLAFALDQDGQTTSLDCALNGFRFAQVESMTDPNFLPGALKYGDIGGFLALRYDCPITLRGETNGALPLLTTIRRGRGYHHGLELTPSAER